jgi:hypothetical protein
MAVFPVIEVGDLVTADLLTSMVPDKTIKGTTTDAVSDITISDDPDLSSIPLAVGTYDIDVLIFVTTVTTNTQDFKTQWSFTGTWNTPIRACVGPGVGNLGSRDAITPLKRSGLASNSDAIYEMAAGAGFYTLHERCDNVVVTVAGLFAFAWAQNASVANATSVKSGSSVTVRRTA